LQCVAAHICRHIWVTNFVKRLTKIRSVCECCSVFSALQRFAVCWSVVQCVAAQIRRGQCTTILFRNHTWIVTWLIHIWDMTHSYMRHDSFIYETWLTIHVWLRNNKFESCHIHEWVMSHTTAQLWIWVMSRRNESCHLDETSRWQMLCCSVLQSATHCNTLCCSVLQFVAVCCSVLQCVAVCCSVMQCVSFHVWHYDVPCVKIWMSCVIYEWVRD